MSSACGSGWCFARCNPHPITPLYPSMPPGRGIWWPGVVLTWVPLTWAHVLLSAIDHLEFSRVLCNRLSSFFICNPQCPLHPISPLDAPTPPSVQASNGQEWYYCRSAWHVISLWVRLMSCQMHPHPITPLCPSVPPCRGIWWPGMVWTCIPLTWAHVLLSAVFNRPSWVFKEYTPTPSTGI